MAAFFDTILAGVLRAEMPAAPGLAGLLACRWTRDGEGRLVRAWSITDPGGPPGTALPPLALAMAA
jgi:hypothetical protein